MVHPTNSEGNTILNNRGAATHPIGLARMTRSANKKGVGGIWVKRTVKWQESKLV